MDEEQARPFIWQMMREGMKALGSPTTNVALRDWIMERFPGTNANSIMAHIISRTVNHPSRIHFPENQKARAKPDERYDFLYRPERGRLEWYEPDRHGHWQIVLDQNGELTVALADEDPELKVSEEERLAFAAEHHLRDFLAKNLQVIEQGAQVFIDENERLGIEYVTPIGRIDLLLRDAQGYLLVVELKVGRGPDEVAGQVLRYRSWVRRRIANGARVRACVIAQEITDKIRYALADIPDVKLMEYEMQVGLREVEPVG